MAESELGCLLVKLPSSGLTADDTACSTVVAPFLEEWMPDFIEGLVATVDLMLATTVLAVDFVCLLVILFPGLETGSMNAVDVGLAVSLPVGPTTGLVESVAVGLIVGLTPDLVVGLARDLVAGRTMSFVGNLVTGLVVGLAVVLATI